MSRYHSLPYSLHCALCGSELPDGWMSSRCGSCLGQLIRHRPSRLPDWARATCAGVLEAFGYVLPIAAAVLIVVALRAL